MCLVAGASKVKILVFTSGSVSMVKLHLFNSPRSKRFRGLFCIIKKPISRFVDAREMGRVKKRGAGRGGEMRGRKGQKGVLESRGVCGQVFPPPPLHCPLRSCPISRSRPNIRKSAFRAENSTETLASRRLPHKKHIPYTVTRSILNLY